LANRLQFEFQTFLAIKWVLFLSRGWSNHRAHKVKKETRKEEVEEEND
jgi:hypothetical protein